MTKNTIRVTRKRIIIAWNNRRTIKFVIS